MVSPKPPAQPPLRAAVPASKKVENQVLPPAPSLPSVPSNLDLASFLLTTQKPRLPVPPPMPPVVAPSAEHTGTPSTGPTQTTQGDQGELVILNLNPVLSADLLRLPPGNRYGAFSISRAGGSSGSPGGVLGGDTQGGTGGPGTGGDVSSGVGSGDIGGGGGTSSTTDLPVSITGGAGATEGEWGILTPPGPADLTLPALSMLQLRQNALLVATGPIGGGGLPVYGVLRGNKIYTKYLSMPGKGWILQYCFRGNPALKVAGGERGAVIQFDPGLVPPDPDEKSDFRRLPVPEDKANEMFVLQGVIREDGSVGELKVLRGFQTEADQAALAAFSRWKFKPALREGKPVAVDILVGIPAVVPQP